LSSNNNLSANFSEITIPIEHSSLLGSSDYSHHLYSTSETVSDHRSKDIDLTENTTLDVLIEELSFNVTMGFFE